ncbi:MAG: hypothetical protein R3C28_23430 [Pirellulaceae bacterium]
MNSQPDRRHFLNNIGQGFAGLALGSLRRKTGCSRKTASLVVRNRAEVPR